MRAMKVRNLWRLIPVRMRSVKMTDLQD